ncbi:MAG: hypothetical protein ABS99_02690 [Acetobacteraceae bacterium SCN 69-10]|nr:hypothetical protein [Rhodospirillales bacterium]ODU60792.1 MAG: hypothetical protein ABS99_02690 [Acetobacteraceae bacterium SCN 69-10]OJY64946.1 MAG: hypothetical protein BGP12_04240 [Rhodospirillales bacterium 70-18]
MRNQHTTRNSGLAALALLGLLAVPAMAQTTGSTSAQVPAGTDPATGARPGNVIGSGNSLPLSDKASNITPGNTSSTIAPNLPAPPLGDGATPRDYLRSARVSLAAGRTGQAQQALEMAETRLLDRSVPQGTAGDPNDSQLVRQIAEARRALASGDSAQAIQVIDGALAP